MTPQQIDNLKISVESHLSNKIKNGDWIYADCPQCGKKAQKNTHFGYNPTWGKYGAFKCHVCGIGGNGYDLALLFQISIERPQRQELPKYKPVKIPQKPEKKPFSDTQKTGDPVKDFFFHTYPAYITRDPATGKKLFGKFRIDEKNIGKKGKPKKSTPQFFYKNGVPVWGNCQDNRPLYGLYEAKRAGATVFYIHEGEKTADKLNEIRKPNEYHLSVTQGNNEKINPVNFEYLRGKSIFLVPDLDAAHEKEHQSNVGQKCMAANYAILRAAGIKSKIIELPTPRFSGYDAEDYINDGHTWHGIETTTTNETTLDFYNKYGFQHEAGKKKFNAQYVNQRIFQPEKKFIVIESPQNTGKTTFIKELVTTTSNPFLYIAHQISLIKQTTEKLNIKCYQDLQTNSVSKYPVQSIGITINSLHKITPGTCENGFLIIDEIDQVIRQLKGQTTNGVKREIIQHLKYEIQKAQKVIFSSADIDEITIDFLHNVLEINPAEIEHYENEFTSEKDAFQIISADRLIEIASTYIKNGKKIAIATTNKGGRNGAYFFRDALLKRNPHAKIFCATSDNARSKEVETAIYTPKFLNQFDAVIYSPTWQSGVDYPLEQFKTCFMIANNRYIATARELVQSIGRFRCTKELYFYISPNPKKKKGTDKNGKISIVENRNYIQFETDPEKIKNSHLQKAKGLNHLLNYSAEKGYFPHPEYKTLFELFAKCEAADNHSKNNLQSEFRNLLQKRGYRIKHTELNTQPHKDTKTLSSNITKELKEKYKDDILNAADIDEYTHETRKSSGYQSQAEFIESVRFEYLKTNGGPVELEKVIDINLKTFQNGVYNTELFRANIEDLIVKDRNDIEKFLPERQFRALKAQIIKTIENKLNLISGGAVYDPTELKSFIELHRADIELNLFKITPAMLEKPGYFLRSFYKLLGLKIKRVGSKKARRYVIDGERLELMQRVLQRREEKREGFHIDSIMSYNKNKPSGTLERKPPVKQEFLFDKPETVVNLQKKTLVSP